MKKTNLLILIFVIITWIIGGCSLSRKKHEWQPIKQKKAPVVHEVQWPKETLEIIAKWYTGDSKNWETLADANPNINPESLSKGNKIFIPSDLLKTRNSMPEKFVASCHMKTTKQKTQAKSKKPPKENAKPKQNPASEPKNVDEFEVIGPK